MPLVCTHRTYQVWYLMHASVMVGRGKDAVSKAVDQRVDSNYSSIAFELRMSILHFLMFSDLSYVREKSAFTDIRNDVRHPDYRYTRLRRPQQ